MERLFKSVLSIRELKFHVDDDYVDRLSRQFTQFKKDIVLRVGKEKEDTVMHEDQKTRTRGSSTQPESTVHCRHHSLFRISRQYQAVRWTAHPLLVSRRVH